MLIELIDSPRPGLKRYRLNLNVLYPAAEQRRAFEERWRPFAESSPDHDQLFERTGDSLLYLTESFIPEEVGERPPVLLVLGNPASQSVRAGMCFAFEGSSPREHRFWRALRAAGWLEFNDEPAAAEVVERNRARSTALLEGWYVSPFRIGVDVLFTIPSSASAPRWSGVSGLCALLGRPALTRIAQAEQARLACVVRGFLGCRGAVVAFQKDAYEWLRAETAVPYSANAARSGLLRSPSAAGVTVPLFGAPPTRLAHSRCFQGALARYGRIILGTEA